MHTLPNRPFMLPTIFFVRYRIIVAGVFVCLLLGLVEACTQERGCTDTTALNYDPDAYKDDGSCVYELPLSDNYSFYRQRHSSVLYTTETLIQLKINDLYLNILALGETGATPPAEALSTFYQSSDDMPIYTPIVGGVALQSTYNEVGNSVVLRNKVSGLQNADSLITAWLDTIAANAQNPDLLGTPAVYTLPNGLDLAQMVHKTLIGAVLYANIMQNISNIVANNNTSLVSGTYYTSMEHVWDSAWGYLGGAADWGSYEVGQVANNGIVFKDSNGDAGIDFTSEYLFYLAAEAVRRDNASPDRHFPTTLFDAFRKGRYAITAKNDTARLTYKKQILLAAEELLAANAVHHLNILLDEMQQIGTSSENIASINAHWAAGYAYLSDLKYYSGNRFTHTTAALQLLGSAPSYALPGSADYSEYVASINWIRSQLGLTYDFSAQSLDNW